MNEVTDYVLWYQKGDGTLQEIPLTKTLTVGSGNTCDLVLPAIDISGKHFRIMIENEAIRLENLSADGEVILENEKIPPNTSKPVQIDQVFIVGEYTFFIRINEPASYMSLQQQSESAEKGETPSQGRVEPAITQMKEEMLEKGRWKIFALVFAGVFVIAMIGSWFLWIQPALQAPTSTQSVVPTTPVVQVEPSGTSAVESATPEATPSFEAGQLPTSSQVADQLTITPPGLGVIDFSTFSISPDSINVTELLNLQLSLESLLTMGLEIGGENIGYVYRYAGLSSNGKLRAVELSYIKSDVEKVVDGVSYPDWGDEPIPVEIQWKPVETYIEDGTGMYPALLAESSYKTTEDAAVFYTTGKYVFSESGEQLYSLMYFDQDGQMVRVVVFNSTDGIAGLPREITPVKGDKFIIVLKDFVFDEEQEGTAELAEGSGMDIPPALQLLIEQYGEEFIPVVYGKGKFVDYDGKTLTFGEKMITFTRSEGEPGDYVVGVAVEDMDGNYYIAYVPIEVVEKYTTP